MDDLDPTLTLLTPVIPETLTEALPARIEALLDGLQQARQAGQVEAFVERHRRQPPSPDEPPS